jgi:hypothetical protein
MAWQSRGVIIQWRAPCIANNEGKCVVQAKLEAVDWKRHPNPATSLHLFYQGLPEKHKLIYEPQCPLPGTPDHEFYHGTMRNRTNLNPSASYVLIGDPDHCEPPNSDDEVPCDPEVFREVPTKAPVYQKGPQVFKYKFQNWTDFVFGFIHKDQLEFAILYTDKPLIMDSTFGTNNAGFPLTTIHGVDPFHGVQPLACCILSRETTGNLCKFLQAFLSKVRNYFLVL